jgi:aspartate racemase
MARELERSGAELLVIPCNSASPFTSDVQKVVDVPVVDWVAEAVGGVLAQHDGLQRIGLLATSGTIASGVYQKAFAGKGVSLLLPAERSQQRVMSVIYDIKVGGSNRDVLRSSIEGVIACLQQEGAQAVLLACTELSLLFGETQPAGALTTYDAAQIVAERVVVLAGGRLKQDDSRATRKADGAEGAGARATS